MPAQKRSLPENFHDDDDDDDEELLRPRPIRPESEEEEDEDGNEAKQQVEEDEDEDEDDEEQLQQQQDKAEDSEGSPSSSSQPKPEFVFVELPEIRKDVQCPICLGIIKKTRTVMECLHRFCRECIDKSMRMGNNECPACRTHCASRRSLRDDPNYDAIIATLYPDIDKYEEEELAFHEEEQTRNKQIQASIAQISQRQSEALIKRRTPGKDTTDTFMTRTQRSNRNAYLRRRSSRTVEHQGSEDNEDGNDNTGKDESSNDERRTEVRQRRRRRRVITRSSRPSSSVANSEGCNDNELEISRENRGISPGLAWNSEILAWGRGGARSHTRHGNAGGWSARNPRLSKLVDYLRSLEENDDELDVHLVLISLDKQSMPSLQKPHLCCRPSLSVKYLCEYVARQTPLKAEEVEILALKGQSLSNDEKMMFSPSKSTMSLVSLVIDPAKDNLQVLGAEETLAGVKASCTSSRDHLILVYRRKGGS